MDQKTRSLKWLAEDVLPLWLEKGVDWKNGGFAESISLDGKSQDFPRRAMVQARQIYSLRIAADLGLIAKPRAKEAVVAGIRSVMHDYSLPSGAFVHSINEQRIPADTKVDLYSQAFCLFGLANAFAMEPNPEFKTRAKSLLRYLQQERKVPGGGFFEIANGVKIYQSNPHMHMFEAAVAWMEVDSDPEWKTLADHVLTLCLEKFTDENTKLIGEHFDENWNHHRENGKFVYEPGHQYEWSWLMGRYQILTKKDLRKTRELIFANGDRAGLCPERHTAYDEVWSDFTVKTASSRFWPQCERIKAASQLGKLAEADQSMNALFRFFETKIPGLWYDTWDSPRSFRQQPAKASSLYHIIGAIEQRSLN